MRVYYRPRGSSWGVSAGPGGWWLLIWLRVAWFFLAGICALTVAAGAGVLAALLGGAGLLVAKWWPRAGAPLLGIGAVLFVVARGALRLIERL